MWAMAKDLAVPDSKVIRQLDVENIEHFKDSGESSALSASSLTGHGSDWPSGECNFEGLDYFSAIRRWFALGKGNV